MALATRLLLRSFTRRGLRTATTMAQPLDLPLPTYYHPIAAKDLARACERAGLEVVLAREQFHPGWPSACPYDGRENAQVVARKKN